MNPDNPNFRTPEEEARAAELVKLKAELAELKWHWQEATKFVMPGEFDTAESIVEFIRRKDAEIQRLNSNLGFLIGTLEGIVVYANDADMRREFARRALEKIKAIEQGEGT